MSCRLARIPQAAFLALLAAGQGAQAQQAVTLERWERRAIHIEHRGPGIEYYRLDAQVQWSEKAPGDDSRYQAQVTLPDGRTLNQDVRQPQGPGSTIQSFFVPTTAIRNLRPSLVVVQAAVLDRTTGQRVSNVLTAGADDFPHPGRYGPETVEGPFHWGRPLQGPPNQPRPLTRTGPDGLVFLRMPASGDSPGFYLASTEMTNQQARRRLPGYDPDEGRSDDFQLSASGQPALNLTAERAQELLERLSEADGTGIAYRLPTRDEWLRAARAGRSTAFWWGDESTHPEGANFLGPEPALSDETTAPAYPKADPPAFAANPWGLFHTFGNVAEWATAGDGRFVRMGGNFRTEPASPLPEVAVEAEDQLGPDPYVGVRPAFELDAEAAAGVFRKVLEPDPSLEGIEVEFDPNTGVATLRGEVRDPAARRQAVRQVARSWFVSAVRDELTLPSFGGDNLAAIGPTVGNPRRVYPLGRVHDVYTLKAEWAGRLPVEGSAWYVNVYLPGGDHYAHALPARDVGGETIDVVIDRSRIATYGLTDQFDLNVALSLGTPARFPTDPSVVSNLYPVTVRAE